MVDEETLSRIRQAFCEEYIFHRGKASSHPTWQLRV